MSYFDQHAKIHAFSSVIVAIIVAVGVIIAAVIVADGEYGRGPIPCMTTNGGGALKAMPSSVTMDIMIIHDETEIGMQRARYDYDKNTILVETPAITDGFSNATIAMDYDRSVVVIKLLDEDDFCYVSALSGDMMDMADRSTKFMEMGHTGHEQAIDVNTADDVEMSYQTAGLIPAGYVTNANGPIIRALCAGDESYWSKPRMSSSRTRRRSGRASARFCIFGFCFNINF
ncbi:uncharacterized protein LOC105437919 isoform X1 [Strongylocentrotus purpuratus]|uniref:Uncharacterized protein n=1 Tax=Strongylocentrotus purpuratus TaxID=7668 RepID=A0A7M7NYK1_STRPU|nr:uncharacterized protein LOC105437919 isoform X1 [Strongylocentrotus purpuratus]